MTKPNTWMNGLRIGLALALWAGLTGCVGGYVEGGYGGGVVVRGPDVFLGGVNERGGDVRSYSHRGVESRAIAHPSGGGREGKR